MIFLAATKACSPFLEPGSSSCRVFSFRLLLLAEDDFALANELIVEPEAVFVGGSLEAGARRAAEKAHSRGRLKDIGGKRAAVDIEFNAQIAGVGDPGDLVAGVENDDLGYESNEYGALCHCSSAPSRNDGIVVEARCCEIFSRTDDSTSGRRVLVAKENAEKR
jgi:hypothetical protein